MVFLGNKLLSGPAFGKFFSAALLAFLLYSPSPNGCPSVASQTETLFVESSMEVGQ